MSGNLSPVSWPISHRIIRTIYPPVHLFEDIADPADWDALVAAEAKFNPRIRDEIGNLALVPAHRRIAGPGASFVMGAFTHVSRRRPSRFSDGSYGVWYCGDRLEVALHETAYHFQRFMRATAEPPATADYRELTCAIHGNLQTATDPASLDPDSWSAGQIYGRQARTNGADGILYPSTRYEGGMAAALFWPDCIEPPILQTHQFRYEWDGARMTRYLVHGARTWIPWAA